MNIAAIICTCRGEIDTHIDMEKIREYCERQQDVKLTQTYEASCSIHDQEDMFKVMDGNIDAMLFIGCSPMYYEKQFQEIFYEKKGINPGKIKFVNIREQLAWIHRAEDKEIVLVKAKKLISAGLEQLRASREIKTENIPNLKSVMVLGGGISGIHATLALANQGYHVYLIEKDAYLGGKQLQLSKAFPRDECSACAITPIINTLSRTPNVEIHSLSEVVDVRGRTGNYMVTIKQTPRFVKDICTNCGDCLNVCNKTVPDEYNFGLVDRKVVTLPNFDTFPRLPFIREEHVDYCRNECAQLCAKVCDVKAIDLTEQPKKIEINVGGIITAIGYDMYKPEEYGYDLSKDILTLEEYERILVSNGIFDGKVLKPSNKQAPKSIAFILCVGARQANKVPYCSRYCCMGTATAIKQTREKLPNAKIYVFYRDIYALGKMGEEYIRETQEFENVEWIRAVPEQFSEIEEGEELSLTISVSGGKLTIPFDMIILATPMVPNEDTENLRELLGLAKTPEGFFKEADMMLAPVSTHDMGKYLAGACVGPRTINESVVDGYAAAASVSRVLSGEEITQFVTISDVDEDICGGEGLCVKTCFFHACSIDKEKKISVVDPTLCRGCGNCVAACPTGARDLLISPSESIYRSIDILAEYQPPEGPKVLGILCEGCAYPAADQVGLSGKSYPLSLTTIHVPCSGRIDPRFVLYAIEKKFDGVILGACYPENCQFIGGNYDLEKRLDLLKELLKARGVNPDRINLLHISYLESEKFKRNVEEFIETLKNR
ncbi:MAG: hydrogenase iron-sulfur subunit [Candidatus Hodarchaeota archaeon]